MSTQKKAPNPHPTPTMRSTWKQVEHYVPNPDTGRNERRPAQFFIVLEVKRQDGRVKAYTIMNLDGSLDEAELSDTDFNLLIQTGKIIQWIPKD